MGAVRPFSLLTLLSTTSLLYLSITATQSNTEFIRTSCDSTLFPHRCFKSLSPFSNKIDKNPTLLARVAITVSLSWANHFVAHLNNISSLPPSTVGPTEGSTNLSEALSDCVSEFADAVDQIDGSLQQMKRLNSHGEQLKFDLRSVQTWMSSAITNEDTCMVGLNGAPEGSVKTDITLRVGEVKEVTSNALSLVNDYVSKVVF